MNENLKRAAELEHRAFFMRLVTGAERREYRRLLAEAKQLRESATN